MGPLGRSASSLSCARLARPPTPQTTHHTPHCHLTLGAPGPTSAPAPTVTLTQLGPRTHNTMHFSLRVGRTRPAQLPSCPGYTPAHPLHIPTHLRAPTGRKAPTCARWEAPRSPYGPMAPLLALLSTHPASTANSPASFSIFLYLDMLSTLGRS